jgi:hypothetical protein
VNESGHVYSKETSVGTFWIRPDQSNRLGLYIESDGDTELLGSSDSASAAADDVYTQNTGWDEWDVPSRSAPKGLDEWEKGNNSWVSLPAKNVSLS